MLQGRTLSRACRSVSIDRLRAWMLLGIALGVLGRCDSTIAQSAAAGDLLFKPHVINAESEYLAAEAMDVDHDGQLDVVCGAYWYEGPEWTRHDVRDVKFYNGRPDGYAHLPMDVNGDGWMDLVAANWRSQEVQWIEHPGPSLGEWKLHVVAKPGSMETARLADIDGDGRLDVLPNGSKFAAWWSLEPETSVAAPNGSEMQPLWQRHDLPDGVAGHGIGQGDIDGDGRVDVVGQFGWASAPKHPRTEPWQYHDDFALDKVSVPIVVADVDDDGDSDLVWCRAHDFGVYWSEQLETAEAGRRWTHHVIDSSWSGGHSPLWADMDGDGRDELVVGKRYLAHEGRDPGEYDPQQGYRYQFDPSTRTWRRRTLTYNQAVGYGLDPKTVDLDEDGDLDLLCGGRNGLIWLENTGPPGESAPAVAPEESDAERLLTFRNSEGDVLPLKTPFDWGQRRAEIVALLEGAIGPLPGPYARVPLDVLAAPGPGGDDFDSQRLSFRTIANERATAMLVTPRRIRGPAPAVFMQAQSGAMDLARALARRGILALVHAPPSARSATEADEQLNQLSPLIREIWTGVRAIDLLDDRSDVDPGRIGVVGFGASVDTALLTAVLDQRIRAVGLGRASIESLDFARDRTAGAASPSESGFAGRPRAPSSAEIIAAVAPRPMLIRIAADASAEEIEELRVPVQAADRVYGFRGVEGALQLELTAPSGVAEEQAPEAMADWLVEALGL